MTAQQPVDVTALTIELEQSPVTSITPTDNRDVLETYRSDFGFNPITAKVYMLKANGKLALDTGSDVKSFGLSLNPATTHGELNTCAWSTDGCAAVCILDNNYQKSDNVRNSRRALTNYLHNDPQAFIDHIAWELDALLAEHGDGNVAVRLNVASDIRWERVAPVLFDVYGSRVRFYDYTKAPFGQRDLRDDYTMVYSVSERATSLDNARKYIEAGHSATIVLPVMYRGHDDMDAVPDTLDVADHDQHDVRSLDRGRLGMLRAKGSARTDFCDKCDANTCDHASGFVRPLADAQRILDDLD